MAEIYAYGAMTLASLLATVFCVGFAIHAARSKDSDFEARVGFCFGFSMFALIGSVFVAGIGSQFLSYFTGF